MNHAFTEEQIKVIDTMKTGKNFVVNAGAGSGKTSTLVEAAAAVTGDGLYTAFNKGIIEEGSRKFRRGISCLTTHKLAYDAVASAYRRRLDEKARQWSREKARLLRINEPIQLSNGVLIQPTTIARYASDAVERFVNSDQDSVRPWHIECPTGVSGEDYKVIQDAVLPYALKIWDDLQHTDAQGGGVFRFNPNHFRKIWALGKPQLDYEFILLDEAQDTAGVVGGLLKRQTHAQIVAIGDAAQSINQWAGAISVMENWPADIKLTLSRSFRFGEEIAEEANKWLGLLGDFRIKGTGHSTVGDLASPRAVLCRTNGCTAEEVLRAQAAGIKVALAGRGAADQIKRLARACQEFRDTGYSSHEELIAFRTWEEVQNFVETDSGGSDLKAFVRLIDNHGADVVEDAMDRLKPERYAQLTVSTMHRAKGLEWDTVRIADDFKEPLDRDGEPLPVPRPDAMLAYVAVTRARHHLDLGGLAWIDNRIRPAVPAMA